jgi:hypothetical protein
MLPYAEHTSMSLDDFPDLRRWHDQLNEVAAGETVADAAGPQN